MKRLKLIYVAGPFRARSQPAGPGTYNYYEQVKNIERAGALAHEVWSHPNATALSPHLNTAPFQGSLPDDYWLEGDIEQLRRCDALLAVKGWEDSTGTLNEIAFAKGQGIPVFYDDRGEREDLGGIPKNATWSSFLEFLDAGWR